MRALSPYPPRTISRALLWQRWRWLTFLHWRYDPGVIQRLLQKGLACDTFEGCARATEMLVLLIQAPPIQGIAAQPTPVPFCFKGPIDLKKLLPQ